MKQLPRDLIKTLNKIITQPYELQLIREKFDIFVFRVVQGNNSYVGKYFGNKQSRGRQEIQHYEMLSSIGVPTLSMLACTQRLMLLEDIQTSKTYRLGTEQDISNLQTARLIAQWFKQLHVCGQTSSGLPKLDLLISADALSVENITNAMHKTNSCGNPFWATLTNHLNSIKHAHVCNTITYNDFWWDNMAVAKDGSSALMFDYNCMYRGYAYSDIRHILSVLTKSAGEAFLEAYGDYSAEEKAFEDVFFPLTGLMTAQAGKFEQLLHNGELMKRLRALEHFL